MEPVGLVVGVAGLAGLFSSCLEAVERFDSYKNYDRDSRSLTTQSDADKHLLEQWGRAVGIENGKLTDSYHPALDDGEKLEIVRKLLTSIHDFCGGPDDATLQRAMLTDGAFLKSGPFPSRRTKQPHNGAPADSKWRSIHWALSGKSKREKQVQTVAALVQYLYILIPINDTKEMQSDIRDASPTDHLLLAKIQALIDKAEDGMKAEIKRDLHAWLGSPSSNDLYDDSIQKRLKGTCEWILERDNVLEWLSPDTSPDGAGVLWINGPAGFGKTVLCARLVEFLSSRLQTPVAHFFLSSKFEGRDDPYTAVRSWISTVFFSSPIALDVVYKKRLVQNEQVATRATVMKLFREVLQAVPSCTFVLDGLDECTWLGENRSDGNSVARFLDELRDAITNTTARLLVASRNELEIRQGLSQFPGFSEYAISPEDVRDDNVAYSRSIVNSKLPNKDEPTRLSISQRMADRSNGQFQWIKMQEGFLRKGRNKKQLEKDIDETPAGLDRLYDRTWERIEGLRDAERNRAFSLLRWAAFALRPLTVCEITEAVLISDDGDDLPLDELPDSVDDDYIESEILGLCGSLVEVRGTTPDSSPGSRNIHLTHFSVKQYLLYKISSRGSVLLANESLRAANETLEGVMLAKLCLRYISFQRVWDESAAKDNNQIGASFRDYAAKYWYQHTDISKADDMPLVEAIHALFDGRVGTWESWRKWFDLNGEGLDPEAAAAAANPLYYASRLGLTGVVRHLTQRCQHDPNENSESGRPALVVACERGYLEVARTLLEAGTKANITDYRRRTPLYTASLNGHLEVLKLMFERGGDLTVANVAGWTPLNAAASNGHPEVVRFLLAKGADVSVANVDGHTPLFSAADDGYVEVVRMLVEKGADIEVLSKDEWTALTSAASNGHIEVVRLLVEKGAGVEAFNKYGWTALSSAASNGHTEVVRLLLERGAGIKSLSNDGWTALSSAACYGHIEVVGMLLEKGADIEVPNQDGWTALNVAANNGHLGVVKLLLDKGADISTVNKGGWTPLQLAAVNGQVRVVRLLLEKGTSPAAGDHNGWTPVHLASSGGHTEVVNLLLENGASPAPGNHTGWTPLHSASSRGHVKIVHLLLENGASPAATDHDGWTPLHSASSGGHVEIVNLFLEKGASPAAGDHNGWTPLHSASSGGHFEVVDLLLKKGASPTARDHDGWTPLAAASSGGRVEVAKLLVEKGATASVGDRRGITHIDMDKLLIGKGADIFDADNKGWTPLHVASREGSVELVRLLLERRPDLVDARDKTGRTSLFYAAIQGRSEAVRLLLSHRASANATDRYNASPLIAAARNGHAGVVEILLKEDGVVRLAHKDNSGRSALCWARQGGDVQTIQLLFKHSQGTTEAQPGDEDDTPTGDRAASFNPSSSWCDVCTTSLPKGRPYHQCKECYGGMFDVCLYCFEAGFGCLDGSHKLAEHSPD
ncbi:Ankyrin-1 [Colletotrichum tanaceti]|nr:Ankyrin-1 [Colletotrichum tanaceti]